MVVTRVLPPSQTSHLHEAGREGVPLAKRILRPRGGVWQYHCRRLCRLRKGQVCVPGGQVWEGREAVRSGRTLIGPTNPLAAPPSTIRWACTPAPSPSALPTTWGILLPAANQVALLTPAGGARSMHAACLSCPHSKFYWAMLAWQPPVPAWSYV